MSKKKLIRITTIPASLKILLKGQHLFMSEFYEVIGISSPGPELDEVMEDEGIQVIPLEMTRTISPLNDLMAVWKLYRILKKEKPLIVHTHTPKAGIVGMTAARLANVPLRLHTVAGLPLMEATGLKRRILNAVEKLTYRFANRVYPNSKGLYEFILAEKFTTSAKLKVIANGSSNGIDATHFDPSLYTLESTEKLKEEIGIPLDHFVFIFIGRLVRDKGINELVSSFQKLHKTYPKISLLLVGPLESSLDPLLPETLVAMKEFPAIFPVDFVKDVRPYFAISNALVFPTYREGFPNVVIQAGAMGIPAIVTDINGCNEIIIEGENGTIIPTKSEAHLREAMLNFVHNREKLVEEHSKYRQMIVDRYEQSIVWQELLNEYKELDKNDV